MTVQVLLTRSADQPRSSGRSSSGTLELRFATGEIYNLGEKAVARIT